MPVHGSAWEFMGIHGTRTGSPMENNLGMVSQRLGPRGRCQESSASASAKGPAAASATAMTHGADMGKDQSTRTEAKQTAAPTKWRTIETQRGRAAEGHLPPLDSSSLRWCCCLLCLRRRPLVFPYVCTMCHCCG